MADVTAYMGVDPALADIRREGSVERGEIRYDVATKTGDIRREVAGGVSDIRREQAVGFDETRYAVAGSGSDIRREQAQGFDGIRYAVATGNDVLNREILNSSHNTDAKVDEAADKIQQRAADFYISAQARDFDNSRDLAALRAITDMSAQKLSSEILLTTEKVAAANALAVEKVGTAVALESSRLGNAVALGQANLAKDIAESKYDLSKQMAYENEKTRDLINDLKNADLNRQLIERNSDINYYRNDCNRWEGLYGNGQFAQLASQINALQSNLAETRQGLYNFGTMAGVGQSSNQNQVR